MQLIVIDMLHALQPAGTTASGGGGGGAAGGAAAGGPGWVMQFLPLILVFVVMYFVMIRPQVKQQREREEMLKALQKGQTVRTDSGIRGEILAITDTEVTLLIAEKTKINILRSRIAGPEKAGEAPKDSTNKD